MVSHLVSPVLALLGCGEFHSPVRRRGDSHVHRHVDEQQAADFESSRGGIACRCRVGRRCSMDRLSPSGAPSGKRIPARPELSAVGAASVVFSRLHARAFVVGAFSRGLRSARLGAAIGDRVPAFCDRAVYIEPKEHQFRVHRSFPPSAVGSGAGAHLDQLAFHGVRRLLADAFAIEALFRNCGRIGRLIGLADGAEVDAELLAFLIEVAAFEAKRPRGVRHVIAVAL